MNRYKVITLTSDYYIMADSFENSDGDLYFHLDDDDLTCMATFVDGFWKAVMICDESESES